MAPSITKEVNSQQGNPQNPSGAQTSYAQRGQANEPGRSLNNNPKDQALLPSVSTKACFQLNVQRFKWQCNSQCVAIHLVPVC